MYLSLKSKSTKSEIFYYCFWCIIWHTLVLWRLVCENSKVILNHWMKEVTLCSCWREPSAQWCIQAAVSSMCYFFCVFPKHEVILSLLLTGDMRTCFHCRPLVRANLRQPDHAVTHARVYAQTQINTLADWSTPLSKTFNPITVNYSIFKGSCVKGLRGRLCFFSSQIVAAISLCSHGGGLTVDCSDSWITDSPCLFGQRGIWTETYSKSPLAACLCRK